MNEREIAVDLTLYIMVRENESEQEALERLLGLLDSELCNLADHQISYQAYSSHVV